MGKLKTKHSLIKNGVSKINIEKNIYEKEMKGLLILILCVALSH